MYALHNFNRVMCEDRLSLLELLLVLLCGLVVCFAVWYASAVLVCIYLCIACAFAFHVRRCRQITQQHLVYERNSVCIGTSECLISDVYCYIDYSVYIL